MSAPSGFPCSNCGAQLEVDGSTPAPRCAFCQAQTQLPLSVWEKFHPRPAPQLVIQLAHPVAPETKPKASISVWLILAIVFIPLLVIGVLASSADVKPEKVGAAKAGAACAGRRTVCSKDKKAQLSCGEGDKLVLARACKGPSGCQTSADGFSVTCDATFGDVNDVCDGDDACSTDHKAELACVAGHFVVHSTCKGQDGCTLEGHTLTCDDHIADVGDPCFEADRTACSSDHKSLLGCVRQHFVVDRACKGPNACSVRKLVGTKNSSIECDLTISDIGAPCEASSVSCDASGKELLSCQSGKLVSEKKCARGCVVTNAMPACR